jgi:hypothetical protein
MGVQRHVKVLGIFARLWHRDGKDGYLKDLPLVARYLRKACERYGELSPLRKLLDRVEDKVTVLGYTMDTGSLGSAQCVPISPPFKRDSNSVTPSHGEGAGGRADRYSPPARIITFIGRMPNEGDDSRRRPRRAHAAADRPDAEAAAAGRWQAADRLASGALARAGLREW